MPWALMGAGMADIFISYSKQNRDLAERVERGLRRAGYTVWWDNSLTPQESWQTTLERELTTAQVVLVLWTKESVKSEWVLIETEKARSLGKLQQALCDEVEVPMFASRIQYADLRSWQGEEDHRDWQRLTRWIADRIGRREEAVANPETEAGRVWATLADSTDVHELELFEETFRTEPEARLARLRRAGLVWASMKDYGTPEDWRGFVKRFAGTPEARTAQAAHYERQLAALYETKDMSVLDAFIAEFDGTEGALRARRQRVALGGDVEAQRLAAEAEAKRFKEVQERSAHLIASNVLVGSVLVFVFLILLAVILGQTE